MKGFDSEKQELEVRKGDNYNNNGGEFIIIPQHLLLVATPTL
jgi:hypothetical protein